MKRNYRTLSSYKRLASSPKHLLAFLITLGVVLFFSTCSSHTTLTGSVEKVIDGDTITLLDEKGQSHKIRFFGIDAPETNTNQPFGEEARAFLAQEIEGKKVQIIIKTKSDKYGRVVGVVKFDGQDINKKMVQEGYAWAYSYYTDAYQAEHNAARAQQIGLWADDNSTNKPIEPYKWRKTHQKKGF